MPIPLVERSERDIARRIRRRVNSLPGVAECKEVTVGFTRKKPNIHFHVVLRGSPSPEEVHLICFRIDWEVRNLVPNARVVIHSEPTGIGQTKDVLKIVKGIVEGEPGSRGVQNIHLMRINGNLGVDLQLHLAVPVKGGEAGDLELGVAQRLRAADTRISDVVVHQESVSYLVSSEFSGHGGELKSYIEHVAKRFPELTWLGPPTGRRMGDGLHLVDRVGFAPGTSEERIAEIVSELTSKVSAAVRKANPDIAKAEIVVEPTNP